MPIIVRDDLADYLSIKNADNDTFLTTLATRVTKAIESYCNRSFQSRRVTEIHSGEGNSGVLFVNNPPIVAIGTLFDDPNRVFGSDTAFATSDYVTFGSAGYVELVSNSRSVLSPTDAARFSRGVGNIKLIFTSGYALTAGYNNVPEDVKQAALLWAAPQFKLADQKLHGVSSIERANSVQTLTGNFRQMPEEVKELVMPYRIRNI